MGRRRRGVGVSLPEGVERVTARGKTYYYWNPGRGTARPGDRIPLPNAETHTAAFWREVERRRTETPSDYPIGSVGDLVARYRASPDFRKCAPKTQSTYGVHLNRFAAPDAWGLLAARDLTAVGVQAARDAALDTPVMANQMLAVGRTLWDWAIPLSYVDVNPFDKVKPLAVADRGHIPWPSWAVEAVIADSPGDLVRLVKLGRMTCQRESDLVRFGPDHRHDNGLWCRPKKTRQRRRSFVIPLNAADALELDRWPETPVTFVNPRFKAPVEIKSDSLYLFSPRGTAYNPESLRSRWNRWLRTEKGNALCQRWRAWLEECVKRYEWEIDPEDVNGPTIHGLRGSGILLRVAAGYDTDQIANDIGMSRPMVDHYMRFRDQMEVAAGGRRRLKLVGEGRPGTSG
jgi:integrase